MDVIRSVTCEHIHPIGVKMKTEKGTSKLSYTTTLNVGEQTINVVSEYRADPRTPVLVCFELMNVSGEYLQFIFDIKVSTFATYRSGYRDMPLHLQMQMVFLARALLKQYKPTCPHGLALKLYKATKETVENWLALAVDKINSYHNKKIKKAQKIAKHQWDEIIKSLPHKPIPLKMKIDESMLRGASRKKIEKFEMLVTLIAQSDPAGVEKIGNAA